VSRNACGCRAARMDARLRIVGYWLLELSSPRSLPSKTRESQEPPCPPLPLQSVRFLRSGRSATLRERRTRIKDPATLNRLQKSRSPPLQAAFRREIGKTRLNPAHVWRCRSRCWRFSSPYFREIRRWVVGRAFNRLVKIAFDKHGIVSRDPASIVIVGAPAALDGSDRAGERAEAPSSRAWSAVARR
jgi:hypothetical protein